MIKDRSPLLCSVYRLSCWISKHEKKNNICALTIHSTTICVGWCILQLVFDAGKVFLQLKHTIFNKLSEAPVWSVGMATKLSSIIFPRTNKVCSLLPLSCNNVSLYSHGINDGRMYHKFNHCSQRNCNWCHLLQQQHWFHCFQLNQK